jgi:spoIIIJ-associated protein
VSEQEEVVADLVEDVEEIEEVDEVESDASVETEGEAAADYLEGLLDIIDADGDIDIDMEGERTLVSVIEVKAGELKHLVGEDGEVLAALQDLTRLAAARETGERSRLMVDIAGHRAAQKAALEETAKGAIAEAQRTAAPVTLAPMNAFERKVVHDAVAAAGLVSESQGEDPDRRVVIRVS